MRRVFVTGGSGFVGRRLLPALTAAGYHVVALDRSGRLHPSVAPDVLVVTGDLLDSAGYKDALAGCDAVLHLAASTGRASEQEHQRVNAQGTRVLLDACRTAGVRRFLFVSSIAVTFRDLTGYPYAQAKRDADEAVRTSGLGFLIVRPTMILGPGAPILGALEKLATLPVAVLPASGDVRIQPIHVDDLVAALVTALETDAFTNEIAELGGPETTSMEALLRRIRLACRGVSGPLLRVPLVLLQAPLQLATALGLGRLLPVTPGQLSSFKNDGVGHPHRLQQFSSARMLGLEAMIGPAATAGAHSPLDAECSALTRYLTGLPATVYVCSRYAAAHDGLIVLRAASHFDRFLVNFARRGRIFARVADVHAALFAPASLLRKKLVLLLAILESCPPFHRMLDEPLGGLPLAALLRLVPTAAGAVVALLAGVVVILPVRVALSIKSGRPA